MRWKVASGIMTAEDSAAALHLAGESLVSQVGQTKAKPTRSGWSQVSETFYRRPWRTLLARRDDFKSSLGPAQRSTPTPIETLQTPDLIGGFSKACARSKPPKPDRSPPTGSWCSVRRVRRPSDTGTVACDRRRKPKAPGSPEWSPGSRCGQTGRCAF
jgi:hypothetical protein